MENITKTYKIYNYNELSKDIQEKLLQKEVNNCQDLYCECFLEDDMKEYAQELLSKYFEKNAEFINVLYDLTYCQGSGAMIEFQLKYYDLIISIKNYGHYTHEYSFELQYKNYNYLSDKRENYLKEKIVDMNKELTKYGYNLINYENFIDEALENLKNENFLENGSIFE